MCCYHFRSSFESGAPDFICLLPVFHMRVCRSVTWSTPVECTSSLRTLKGCSGDSPLMGGWRGSHAVQTWHQRRLKQKKKEKGISTHWITLVANVFHSDCWGKQVSHWPRRAAYSPPLSDDALCLLGNMKLLRGQFLYRKIKHGVLCWPFYSSTVSGLCIQRRPTSQVLENSSSEPKQWHENPKSC